VRQERLAYGALFVAILGWGSLHVAAKPVVPIVGPIFVALDRTAIAAIVLTLLCIGRGTGAALWSQYRQYPGQLLLLGFLSFFGSSILALAALDFLPASINSILNNLGPLWLALGTTLTGKSQRPWLLAFGSFLAIVGVIVVLAPQEMGTAVGKLDWRGVALSVASSVIIVFQALYGRKVMPGRDALVVTAGSATVTVPFLLVFAMFTTDPSSLRHLEPISFVLLLYLGIVCTAMNFACFNFALKHLSATRATNVTYLIPPIGVALSVLILHERAGWNLAFGLGATVVGIIHAHYGTRRVTPHKTEGTSAVPIDDDVRDWPATRS